MLEKLKLGDITVKIGSGATPTGGSSAYKTEGISLIRSQNVHDLNFSYEGLAFIDDGQADELSNVVVCGGDILLNITGDSVARVCRAPKEVLPARVNQHVAIIRLDETKADNEFTLYYLLFNKSRLLTFAQGGSTRNALTKGMLEELEIFFPPLSIQRRIAEVLGRYDALIENYQRQIGLLEALAQNLYREWFVRGRCPDAQAQAGGLPIGWERVKVNDCFEILGGGTPSTEEPSYWENGTINWYTPTDVTALQGIFSKESSTKISETGLRNSSARMFPAYSVMMTSRATIGAVAINTEPATTNQGFITCLPNERFSYPFIYFWILHNKHVFEMLASGATFLEITKGVFKEIEIVVPPDNALRAFDKVVLPLFSKIENLQSQIIRLRQMRDKLLPRLMSGQLVVEANEKM